ncbi:MAG: hypothetical protein KC535_02055 [Nanoarchaeota archaeon]|nr:hypothetical protein [Nanoarchaeota archaeon]
MCVLILLGCESLNNSAGETYNYFCAYQANKLSEESNEISQKMTDMGCLGIVESDALYARCRELEADNKQVVREWKELSCTDDSLID